jgi:hypothetical protein
VAQTLPAGGVCYTCCPRALQIRSSNLLAVVAQGYSVQMTAASVLGAAVVHCCEDSSHVTSRPDCSDEYVGYVLESSQLQVSIAAERRPAATAA